jgi:hypothetical protein
MPAAGEGSVSASIGAGSVSSTFGGGPIAASGQALTENQVKLGRALLAAGALTHQDLQRNIEKASKQNAALAKALLASGFAQEEDLLPALVSKHRVPRINLRTTKIPLETIELLKEETARKLRVLPLDEIGEILVVVTPDLFNADALVELRRSSGRRIALVQCAEEGFDDAVSGYYKRVSEAKLPAPPAAVTPPLAPTPVALPGTPGGAPVPLRAPTAAAAAPPAPAAPAPVPALAAPPEPAPQAAPLAALPAAASGPIVAALPAEESEMAGAAPIDGGVWERRPDWDWAYAGAGPVVAGEALM